MIGSWWEDEEDHGRSGSRRRYYKLTATGKQVIQEELQSIATIANYDLGLVSPKLLRRFNVVQLRLRSSMSHLQLLTPRYYEFYRKKQKFTLHKHFNRLKQIPVVVESFRFYIASSAIFSSQIEGVDIDFNSYMRFQETQGVRGGKDIKQVQDLVTAYEFARTHALNLKNAMHSHALSSRQLATKKFQGHYRNQVVYVYNLETGQRVYEAAPAGEVEAEMDKLFSDVKLLRKRELTIDQVFYYASFIHLIFAKIHPFVDGNGRTARLLEKWFLADKLGANAWFIQSERNYQRKRIAYYKNIDIGPTYRKNDYDHSLDFLLMLPWALKLKI